MTESAQVMMEEREELDDLHRSKTSCGCCVLNISGIPSAKKSRVYSNESQVESILLAKIRRRVGNGRRWNRYRPEDSSRT